MNKQNNSFLAMTDIVNLYFDGLNRTLKPNCAPRPLLDARCLEMEIRAPIWSFHLEVVVGQVQAHYYFRAKAPTRVPYFHFWVGYIY